jgi:hypothetical protein
MRKLTLILIAGGVVLSGCSQSTTSSSNAVNYSDDSTLSKVKNMFRSKKNVTTKDMKTSTLIASAFNELELQNYKYQGFLCGSGGGCLINNFTDKETFLSGINDDLKDFAKDESSTTKFYKTFAENNSNYPEFSNFILKEITALKSKDKNSMVDFLAKYQSIKFIQEANKTCSGWYSNTNYKNSAIGHFEVTYFSNSLETYIANDLLNKTFYSEKDAKNYIINKFLEMPYEQLIQYADEAKKVALSGSFSANMTGVQGMQFSIGDNYIACTPDGNSWKKSNDIWFGSGNLSGQTITSKVEYSSGLEQSKSYKIDVNSGAENSTANGADNSVKSK